MTQPGFSPSNAARRLAVIAFAYVLGAITAGGTVWLELQVLGHVLRSLGGGREVAAWALELTRVDPGLIGPIVGGLMIVGAIPALLIITICERNAVRSAAAYALAGAITLPLLALIGAGVSGGLADLGSGGLLILVGLAPLPGFVGGLVYWAIAGHAAGKGWGSHQRGAMEP
ncbi:MAG: hypothetical protein AAGD23_11730 [Pseudomonadota bacterium]